MAEPEVRISNAPEESADVEMQGGDDAGAETGVADAQGEEDTEISQLKPPRQTFVDSPSPSRPFTLLRRLHLPSNTSISLPDTDLEATSAVLEYLYTGEYFPHKLSNNNLQTDTSIPATDETGDQLLKHAKVYTLAEKLGMPALRALSHSKIHLVNSNAVAELAYARYVYSHTEKTDSTIRKPVASFWGQRSHVLRHETEGTFREMCLEFPEFAFDVLSFVLDAEERREERKRKSTAGEEGAAHGSGRKRARG